MKLVNVQIIKDELERLIRDYRFYSSTEAKYRCEAYKELSEWLDGLDVKDDMDTIHPIEDVVSNDPIANSYKEKYEQALEVAKKTYDKQPIYREWLEKMFPELKESEDEKIRKDIKRAISVALDYSYFDKETANNCLAWLEKQGEQKPSDEEMKTLLRTEYEKGRADAIAEMQKEWSEEDEKEYKYVLKFVDNILNNCGNKKDYEHCKRCYDWLKSLRPQNRWKPSERQLVCIQDAIEHFNLMGSPATTLTEILKQLRKLKEGKI